MSVPPTAYAASFNEGNSCAASKRLPIKIPRRSEGSVAQFVALGKTSHRSWCGAQIRRPIYEILTRPNVILEKASIRLVPFNRNRQSFVAFFFAETQR